jgi:kumamolisin
VVLLNQKLGRRLGFINPALYSITPPNGLRDITQGSNGAFSAGPGWDACTGKGTPIGAKLLAVLAREQKPRSIRSPSRQLQTDKDQPKRKKAILADGLFARLLPAIT